MSEQRDDSAKASWVALSIDELARLQGAREVTDVDELASDVWESDEELDAFLADLRASRAASLA